MADAPKSPPGLSSSSSSVRSSSASTLRSVSFPDDDDDDDTRSISSNGSATSTSPTTSLSDKSAENSPPPSITAAKSRPTLHTAKTTGPSPRSSLASPNGLRATATRNLHNLNMRNPKSPPLEWQRRPRLPRSQTTLGVPVLTTPTAQHQPSLAPRLHVDQPWGPSRRTPSWLQTGKRKTAKEIEAEYDDDDEDLPEDAILANVPLSPRPLHARAPSFSIAPAPSQAQRKKMVPPPLRRTTPETGDLRLQVPRRATRTKSWDEAMQELSDDARKLTAAFETQHYDFDCAPRQGGGPAQRIVPSQSQGQRTPPDESDKEPTPTATPAPPETLLRPQLPPRTSSSSSSGSSTRTSTSSQPRSPLPSPPSKGYSSQSLDLLPHSKEKERLLSKTRPSWLPPKPAKEDRRHMRQWEAMMARYRGPPASLASPPLSSAAEAAPVGV